MDIPSATLVDVLVFLLPGFVAAAVYYSLSPAARPIPFERIVQALIFTIFIQASLFVTQMLLAAGAGLTRSLGAWTENVRLVWSLINAVVLGVLMAWISNRDKLHAILRRAGITDQTSHPSEWYGAMCMNKGYVVLHLMGNRRLYGWPQEWPSTPDKGHFAMAKAQWLTDDGAIELPGVNVILIRAEDVERVELMTVLTELKGDSNERPESTNAAATATAKASGAT